MSRVSSRAARGALVAALVAAWLPAVAADAVPLPPPRQGGGLPLLDALRERRSVREFSPEPLSREQVATLLWAAFGVNRPATGQRTAPSTMNLRCLDVYVATAEGTARYDAERHALAGVGSEDARALTGGQDYVKQAAVALIYVADHSRMVKVHPAERALYAAADAGFIAQNVYLFCAAEGLGSVVHVVGDTNALGQALQLRPDQRIVLAHAVGRLPREPASRVDD